MKKLASPFLPLVCSALLSACATHPLPPLFNRSAEAAAPASIPEPVQQSAGLAPPRPAAKVETYSVTVHKVPVQSLLFALARDAGLNVDIHPGIEGNVTLNALDQTMPQLLSRIARQVDMRYEIDGNNLIVLPDAPEWRNYKIDYVNIARSTSSSVNIATQISTNGGGNNNNNNSGNGVSSNGVNGQANTQSTASSNNGNEGGNNNSTTSVNNRSDNNFWYSLEKNIRDMLRPTNLNDNMSDPLAQFNGNQGQDARSSGAATQQTAQQDPAQSGLQAPKPAAKPATSVVVNAEGGLIAVRATARQHQKIREFLDIVQGAAKRQVLIEATIIEVRLSDQYQQGINWSSIGKGGLKLTQGQVGSAALPSDITPGTTPGIFVLNFANTASRLGNIAATIQLLESFGKVKVLSSPKISVLNNQTALLKVVDNNVFFSIKVTPAVIGTSGQVSAPATYESHLETVPVGFAMSVTPQISEQDEVTLNVRPTITRIVGYVQDPNPALADAKVISKVPVIQARELESIMKINSGQMAVMGGLMQDSVDNAKDGVPGLSSLPVVGDLFSYRNESSSKTELVIFMRPVVLKDASVNGDFKDFRYLLPDQGASSGPGSSLPPPASAIPSARVNGS